MKVWLVVVTQILVDFQYFRYPNSVSLLKEVGMIFIIEEKPWRFISARENQMRLVQYSAAKGQFGCEPAEKRANFSSCAIVESVQQFCKLSRIDRTPNSKRKHFLCTEDRERHDAAQVAIFTPNTQIFSQNIGAISESAIYRRVWLMLYWIIPNKGRSKSNIQNTPVPLIACSAMIPCCHQRLPAGIFILKLRRRLEGKLDGPRNSHKLLRRLHRKTLFDLVGW